ncbi:MAG: protein translocase subunit SecF [Hydrogenibacillus sp.]|nr:protein translocase subunit SecF [Hydrogenibacillus sp.]
MPHEPFYYRVDFVRRRRVFFLLSLLLLAVGLISLAVRGLNLGVDFTSGTRIEVQVGKEFADAEVYALFREQHAPEPSQIAKTGSGTSTTLVLRYKGALSQDEETAVRQAVETHFGQGIHFAVSKIDPIVGRELARKAAYTLLIAAVGIVLYMSLRFEFRMAVSAIVSILNVVVTVIGIIAFLHVEVDVTFVTALLTIVGYSINDTVIIFDRIRENVRHHKLKRAEDVEAVVNQSIRQVFVRSVNTVATVLFAALALLVLGGEGLYLFSLTLSIGLVLGAYSSIFTAAQLWVEWRSWGIRRRKTAGAES